MRMTKLKKYISWNLISLIGYCSIVIVIYFLIILMLSSSQIGMRKDLDKYFYDYMFRHVIAPYLSFYKVQLTAVCFLALSSIIEKKHYNNNFHFGLRIFENHEKIYSIAFIIGLALNFLPFYIFMMMILKIIMRII